MQKETIRNRVNRLFGIKLKSKIAAVFIDTAIKILISVICGGLMLGGTYAVVQETVLPSTEAAVESMFIYEDEFNESNESNTEGVGNIMLTSPHPGSSSSSVIPDEVVQALRQNPYTMTAYDLKGVKQDFGPYNFDQPINVKYKNAKLWVLEDGTPFAYGDNFTFHVSGNVTIKATTNETDTPFICIPAHYYLTDFNNRFIVCVQSTTFDKEITESGVIYRAGDKEKPVYSNNNNGIFMAGMNGFPSTGTAQAYMVIDGVTYYSNIVEI